MDKTILGIVIGTVILIAGVALYVSVASQSVPLRGQELPIQPAIHIQPNQDHEPYNSNPPTSGWHWANPAAWGIYEEEQVDEQLVHNLEHGGVNVFYHPEKVDQDTIKSLENLVRPYRSKVILAPRKKNEQPIALTSWGRLLTLTQFDEQKIKDFIKNNRNHGPEFVPD